MSDLVFYITLGWQHIMSLDALDHILFLVVLAARYRLQSWRGVLMLITAFTIGHAATLALTMLQLLSVPTRLVEFLIPCTILFTALANLLPQKPGSSYIKLNYLFAFFFGLVHGMGFANTLRFILAGDQSLGWALFGFNIGLEAGQAVIVLVLLLSAEAVLRLLPLPQRAWIVFLSAIAFGLSLQMAVQRWPARRRPHHPFSQQASGRGAIWGFEKVPEAAPLKLNVLFKITFEHEETVFRPFRNFAGGRRPRPRS